jgi:hypothetical protein
MSTEHAPRSVWPVTGPEGVRLGNNRLSGVGEDFDDQGGSTRVSSVLGSRKPARLRIPRTTSPPP